AAKSSVTRIRFIAGSAVQRPCREISERMCIAARARCTAGRTWTTQREDDRLHNAVMTIVERLRIFVASPGDVARERDHVAAVAEEINRGVAAREGYALEVVRWQTHARPDVGRAQQIIFDQVGRVDIFIGIMWQRFGTPSGVA